MAQGRALVRRLYPRIGYAVGHDSALHALCRRTFNRHSLDAIVLPTVPTFMAVIQNTDPGSNAGVPGLQIPLALGA